MSDNKTIVEAAYAAFAKGDVPAVLGMLDPKVEWTEAAGFPLAGTYVGPEAVVENVFAQLMVLFDGFGVAPDRFVADGDTVVATGTYSGTGKSSGKAFSTRFAHVWEMRDGKAVRFEQIVDSVPVRDVTE